MESERLITLFLSKRNMFLAPALDRNLAKMVINYACQRNSLSPSVLGWLGINEFVKKHPSCRPDLVLEQEHGNYRSCHGTPWHAFADPVAFEEERECGKGGKCGAGKKGAQDHGGLSRPRSRHWAEEDDRSTCGRNGTRK